MCHVYVCTYIYVHIWMHVEMYKQIFKKKFSLLFIVNYTTRETIVCLIYGDRERERERGNLPQTIKFS